MRKLENSGGVGGSGISSSEKREDTQSIILNAMTRKKIRKWLRFRDSVKARKERRSHEDDLLEIRHGGEHVDLLHVLGDLFDA